MLYRKLFFGGAIAASCLAAALLLSGPVSAPAYAYTAPVAAVPTATPEEMERIKQELGFISGVGTAYHNGMPVTPDALPAYLASSPIYGLDPNVQAEFAANSANDAHAANGVEGDAVIMVGDEAVILPDGTTYLDDGSLRSTVIMTILNHPIIKAFQENRIASDYDVSRARSGWFPRVDARAGYGTEMWHAASTRANGTEDTWYTRAEASATLQQTLWDGLATASRVDQALAKLDSVDSRLFDNAETLAFDAVMAHIDVLRQRELVRLCQLNVEQHEGILTSQIDRESQGSATAADVTQTQGRLSRSQTSLVENMAALATAEAAYIRLTGVPVPELLEFVDAPKGTPETLEMILAEAQANNPKIEALKSDVLAAEEEIGLARSAFHPFIYGELGVNYKYQIESSRDEEWGVAAMLRVNWNLFNGGYDYYNVRGSSARARQAKQELLNQIDQIGQDARNTWSAYQSAIEQARLYLNSVNYNLQTRDAYLEQFDVGQRSLLDVLDAENELFSSSLQEVTARLNVIATQYRLLALEGKLLETFEVERDVLRRTEDEMNEPNPLLLQFGVRDENAESTVMTEESMNDAPEEPAEDAPFFMPSGDGSDAGDTPVSADPAV